MPLTIPTYGTAGDNRSSILQSTDIDAIVQGLGGDGVLTGCAVTAQGSPNMTVAVAAGEIRYAGVNYAITAGNGTIAAADATNPRIDLVSANTSGGITVTAGTAAANPVPPAIPANNVPLAFVDVPANDTTIATNQISDKRLVLANNSLYFRPKTGTTVAYDIPGVRAVGYTETVDLNGNTIYYMPFVLPRPITVDKIGCEVSGFNDAGDLLRMGLTRINLDAQPVGAPIIDQQVDVSTTGVKEAAVSVTVQPGIYAMVLHPSNLIRLKGIVVANQAGFSPALGNDRYINALTVSRTYAALPTPCTAWTTIGTNYQPAWVWSCYLHVSSVG